MSSAERTIRMEKTVKQLIVDTSLVQPTSRLLEPDVSVKKLSSFCNVEGKFYPKKNRSHNMRVPVMDVKKHPLMPTTAARARLLLDRGQASVFWSKMGIFCIILKKEVIPSNQDLAVGIDPGSSYEGWSIVGAKATVLNGMSESPKHVKKAVEQRRIMRKARRSRKCRRRLCRNNRNINKTALPPSTFARWNAKIRILNHLRSILPISDIAIEDVAARTKEGKDLIWNNSFSPIELGKTWFYTQIQNTGLNFTLYSGKETKKYRDWYMLSKSKNKSEKSFSSHAVDAWVMAATMVGAFQPTNKQLYYWTPIVNSKRSLHRAIPKKGGIRSRYGGTRCLGITKGTLVKYQNKLQYVSGSRKMRISLTSLLTGKRITQNAKPSDINILTHITFRTERLIENRNNTGVKNDPN